MESFILMLVLSMVPVLGLLAYFWSRDKGEKEPLRLMRRVFFWGVAVILPVGFFEDSILTLVSEFLLPTSLIYQVAMPFLLVALPEELAKFLVVKQVAYNNVKFNEVMDGITYAVLASMGFAVLENVLYALNYGMEVVIMRAFTAVPAHALFTGIMGYYMGLARFQKDKAKEKSLLRRGLLTAVLFHGLYDFLLFSNTFLLAILIFPLIAYMATLLHEAIKQANKGSMKAIQYF